MSLFSAQLHPQRALGFLVLGASLHDILTRLKAEPQRFPKLEIFYSPTEPLAREVAVSLPANGIRLKFDAPEQRLRLIEVLDFTKNHIVLRPSNEKDRDLVRPPSTSPSQPQEPAKGPTFRHIYHRFLGPTYPGEFIPTEGDAESGIYVLSYPGVAFTFPMSASDYSSGRDNVALMSSSGSQVATSMAVFSGNSWAEARHKLWTEVLPGAKTLAPIAKGGRDLNPDEVSLVRIHGGGKLQLFRRWTDGSTWITLGETTPQHLVADLGPPDAIYRKNDQKMYIHQLRAASDSRARPGGSDLKRHDDLTDTDQSSAQTGSDDYDSNEDAIEDEAESLSGECFYNYFYLGFDILISTPAAPSRPPPSQSADSNPPARGVRKTSADQLVATKMILHGNVPGSYPFNRHRRCRWDISYLKKSPGDPDITSETPFVHIQGRLREEWRSNLVTEDEARQQRGMVLNRGWGDSPGSSCELLGGWEESGGWRPGVGGRKFDGSEDSTTTLYGYPGLVFEVLRNGFVSAVTVF